MQYTTLGTSALHISRIGFGCMSLKPDQDIQALIDEAIEGGINYFDTADLYDKGINESNLGKALSGKRQRVILATKGGNQWRPDGSGWNWNPSKAYLLKTAEDSLRRLQTDYIDLYQLHGGTINDPIDETIEAFELLKQQGKIRYYGISSIRPNVIREYVKRSNIVSVMMQYSLLDRRPEEACLDLLRQHHIGVLARGTVAGGLLADKAPAAYLNYTVPQVATVAGILATVGNHPATTAIRYVLRHAAVSASVVGIRTDRQLAEALEADRLPLLTEQEYHALQTSLSPNYYEQHR